MNSSYRRPDHDVLITHLPVAPKISRHLAYLRNAGIVSARREGKWMHYRIVMSPHIGAIQILRQTLEWLKEDKVMQAE